MGDGPRKRIWVQSVAVSADVLEIRLNEAIARGLTSEQEETVEGVRGLLRKARDAAFRVDPIPGRFQNWASGVLVEEAFSRLHAARAEIVRLYDKEELMAEVPSAIARHQETMHRDDPRRVSSEELAALPLPELRPRLSNLIADTYDALDQEHARLRSFRNIVLAVAASLVLFVGGTIAVALWEPTAIPLCFDAPTNDEGQLTEPPTPSGQTTPRVKNCPSGTDVRGPHERDVPIVALVGLLGGTLAAAVSIRNLRGTTSAYDVPLALAALKAPLGAFTAILGLVAIRGGFIPGLSALDSQEQILAYALILGYGQQAFTRLLDQKAQNLLDELPAKNVGTAPASAPTPGKAPGISPPADGGESSLPEQRLGDLDYLENPEGDTDDQLQDTPSTITQTSDPAPRTPPEDSADAADEGEDVMEDAPEKDHT